MPALNPAGEAGQLSRDPMGKSGMSNTSTTTAERPAPPATVPAWTILGFVSLALFGNYYVYDAIGPVADLLQRQLGFTDTQIGTLNAIYSAPNVIMVLIGGVI